MSRRRAARDSALVLGFSVGLAVLGVAIGMLLDKLAEDGRRQRGEEGAAHADSPKPVNRVRAGSSPVLNPQQPQPGVRA
jgi:hypothetical protein